ncbi:hypothetical protein EPA93_45760 [Ktedonosporobacter rubrisoli]|uniref:Allene oxide cyclase n=1 Tax=Ktedonosporobacter rubrisoli TaxID=2509675 RepID=A0A4P6K5Q9_KTERU|nr:hypothetical protein [Ktedonosporobacter rubrisoli]QBD82886.1 hypothetical protein EPA93_45760 [Ktedonosporobacter rubrisoli]
MKRLLPFALLTFSILGAVLFTMSQMSQGSLAHASSNKNLAPVYEHNQAHFFGNPNHKTGDRIEFANQVYDANNENVIGSSDGECFFASETVFQCDWTLMLPDGNIVISGAQNDQQANTVYAIVGGTGAYSHIQGEVTLTSIGKITNGEAPQYKYTFHL